MTRENKTAMGKIPELREAYYRLSHQLYVECIEFLKKFLSVMPSGFEVSETEYYQEYSQVYGSLCITYDGGNHPEYAATPYAEVKSLSLVDGEIKVETDHGDMYEDSIGLSDYLDIIQYLERWSELPI